MIKSRTPFTYGILGDAHEDKVIEKFQSIIRETVMQDKEMKEIFLKKSKAHQALFLYLAFIHCYRDLEEYEKLDNYTKAHFNVFYNAYVSIIKSHGLLEELSLD